MSTNNYILPKQTYVSMTGGFGTIYATENIDGNRFAVGGSFTQVTDSTGVLKDCYQCGIFTKEGIGIGSNYVIGKRIRDLYNKITVSDVIFDSPIGPEVLSPSPEGTFQTQLRITFEVYEEL